MIKNRYVFSGFWKIFLLASASFLLLFLLIQILTDLPDILKAHQTINLKTYGLILPGIFVQISPIITFLSGLFLIAEMLKYHEIRVLETAGIKPFQIYRILFFSGALVALLVFLVNDRLVPPCLKATKRPVFAEEVSFSSSDILLYGRKFLAPGYLEAPWISYFLPEGKLLTVQGKSAYYRAGYWEIYQGNYWLFGTDGQVEKERAFSRISLRLPLEPEVLTKLARPGEQLSFRELKTLLNRLKKLGVVPGALRVNLQEKVAYPLLNLFILFASIPFFLCRERLNRFLLISFSMLFSFFCYVFYSTSIALGRNGKLPASLAAWLVHLFVLLVSGVFLVRLQRQKKSIII